MATFTYKAGDSSGRIINGKLEADNLEAAAATIKSQGLAILHLKEGDPRSFDVAEVLDRFMQIFQPELSGSERVMFTTNFAEMLKTGLPIVEAISTFEDEGSSPSARRMFQQIVAEIRAGHPPSTAFAKFPKSFPPIYTQIMVSGETTGTMGETMGYLATQLKKDHDLISKVKGSLTYPIVVSTVMFAVLGFITFSVLPKITAFITGLGQDLPFATKLLITTNRFIINNSILIAIFGALAFAGFIKFNRTDRGRRVIDGFMLRVPIFGSLVKKFDLARFCRLLGAFYHYGISLPQAFDSLSTSLANYYYRTAAKSIKENVSRGVALSEALDREDPKLFPRLMVRVIRGAERSAGVDDSLWRLAEFYEGELENVLKNLTTIIEPILIIVLGLAVVGIAVAVVVPIYRVTVNFS